MTFHHVFNFHYSSPTHFVPPTTHLPEGLVFLLTCAILKRKLPFREEASTASPDEKKLDDGDSERVDNEKVATKIARSTPRQKLKPGNDATPFAVDVTPISAIDAGFSSMKKPGNGADSSIFSSDSTAEKSFRNEADRKGRTSRRALFRHRKLEDVCSDDDCGGGDASSAFPSSFVASPEKELKAHQQQQQQHDKSSRKETPTRRSAKKGGDSSLVQYNRMRCESEVEIDLADGAGLGEFRA